MSENSKIEWCDHTFNPWEGCQKVGPGCDHCYAEARNARFGGGVAINWGPGAPRRRTSLSNWRKPLAWNAAHTEFLAGHGRRQRVFCASLADVFDNAVPTDWRMDLFELISKTPNLDWLLLTKRIGNVRQMCSGDGLMFDMLANRVWLGATICSQAEADRDIPKLLETRARVKFLSMEPLLGAVDISDWLAPGAFHCATGFRQGVGMEAGYCGTCAGHAEDPIHAPACHDFIDWVIVGGESGPNARPMHPDWARDLRDQCARSGVPFLFKQWGEWKPISQMDETRSLYRSNRIAREGQDQGVIDELYGTTSKVDQMCLRSDGHHVPINSPYAFLQGASPMQAFKIGKRAAGRLLDGRTHDESPMSHQRAPNPPNTRD